MRADDVKELIWEFLVQDTDEVIRLERDSSLDNLVKDRYAKREEITTLTCNGKPAYAVLRCPKCGGSDLESMGAWIHVRCGSISYKEGVCPKCGIVDPSEMVYIGPVYRCRNCGALVNYPLISTVCDEMKLGKIFIYRITNEGREIIREVERIVESLPNPKVKFIRIGDLRVEALIIGQRGVKTVILSSGEDSRKESLERIGINVETIRI